MRIRRNVHERYQKYHLKRKIQKDIISKRNFTYRNIIAVLSKLKIGAMVLDVGSGVGTIDFYLAAKGKEVVGVEISKNAVKIARKNAITLGLDKRLKFLQGDFLAKKIKGSFDLIICSEVLEHLKDDKKALEKINRALDRDGTLVVTVPSVEAPLFRLGLAYKFDKRVGHLRRYSVSGIRYLLNNTNFKISDITYTEGIIRNSLFVFEFGDTVLKLANKVAAISDLITFFDNLSIKLFGASQLIFVVKK